MRRRPDARLYQKKRPRLMRQHHGRCSYCRRRLRRHRVRATIDHIVPYRDGGPPDAGNLRLACPPCNWLRDALMLYAGIADPQGAEIVRIYASVLLLLGGVSQSRGRLAAAGVRWELAGPALAWLIQGELAVRGQGCRPGWKANRTGLGLARAVRTGERDVNWLRRVLGDPRMVHYARRGPRGLAPALLACYVDSGGGIPESPSQVRAAA